MPREVADGSISSLWPGLRPYSRLVVVLGSGRGKSPCLDLLAPEVSYALGALMSSFVGRVASVWGQVLGVTWTRIERLCRAGAVCVVAVGSCSVGDEEILRSDEVLTFSGFEDLFVGASEGIMGLEEEVAVEEAGGLRVIENQGVRCVLLFVALRWGVNWTGNRA